MRFKRSAMAVALVAGMVAPMAGGMPTAFAGSEPSTPSSQYSWSNAAIAGGGYVPGIIYNPSEEGLVYARTDIGGAYRLDRESDQWVQLLGHVGWDDWNRLGVISLATDPVETNRVYVATGMYTNDWDPNNGSILRSSDYGATWQVTELPFKIGGNMSGRGISERLQIDPNDTDILYFGAEQGQGLWRSTDAGVTFSAVSAFPNAGNFVPDAESENTYLTSNLGVLWTAFDAASGSTGQASQTIFTAVADTEDILYRSDDAGATWHPVAGAPKGFLPQRGVIDQEGRFLYITTTDTSGPYDGSDGAVWRYDMDAGTWTDITPPQRPVGGDFGFGGFAIDKNDPDTVMVASQVQWWPDILIFRSTDRGENWSPIWDYKDEDTGTSFAGRYSQSIDEVPWLTFGSVLGKPTAGAEPSPKLGWMVSSLEIDPFNSDEMMYGTGATIYRSSNLTAWDQPDGVIDITPGAFGIEETAIQDLVAPAGDVDLLSGMLDLGGFVHENLDTVPQSFRGPYFGASTSVDGAGMAANIMVRAGTNENGAQLAAVSTDSGKSWTESPAAEGANGSGTVTVNSDGTRVLWAPSGAAPRLSSDSGASYAKVTGLPNGARVESDRVNAEAMYGFDRGNFYQSTDGGATFMLVNTGVLPIEGNVRFAATPGKIGDIWLAGGSEEAGAYGLWHSMNGGKSWTAASAFDAADTVGFGKAAPGSTTPTIFTAASRDGQRGVYRSIDGGSSWVRINDDENQWGWIGADIEGDPDLFGRVYIATNGLGIVVGDDDAAGDTAEWNNATVFTKGDVVTHDGAEWVASWWSQGDKPGSSKNGPWQEIAASPTGLAVWTPSRIFVQGDLVTIDDVVWRAKWWTRGDQPGTGTHGAWERLG